MQRNIETEIQIYSLDVLVHITVVSLLLETKFVHFLTLSVLKRIEASHHIGVGRQLDPPTQIFFVRDLLQNHASFHLWDKCYELGVSDHLFDDHFLVHQFGTIFKDWFQHDILEALSSEYITFTHRLVH